jgi:hypothetical protein
LLDITSGNSQITLSANGQLEAIGICPTGLCLARGTAQHVDSSTNGDASWGRWTGGAIALDFLGFKASLAQNGSQSIHYLIGTPATVLPTAGTFTYTQIGATTATVDNGSASTGTFSGTLGVTFAPGAASKVGLSGAVLMNGTNYQFSTAGGASNPGASSLTLNSSARFSGTLGVTTSGTGGPLNCNGGSCDAQIRGGLFGVGGNTAGFGYRINGDGSITINGIGVFRKQ